MSTDTIHNPPITAKPKRKRKHQEWTKILVRLKPEDEAVLRQLAASEARSPSNLLRLLALRYIQNTRQSA